VAVRDRIDGDQGAMPVEAAIERLVAESRERRVRQVASPATPGPLIESGESAEQHAY
jgi:threonyl-tRNA synthetase